MAKTYDLDYIEGDFYTTFWPNTPQGESACKQMKEAGCPDCRILSRHLRSVLGQLRRAGYSVRKAPKPAITMDDIFAEMDAMGWT